jgi:hypothetical protein
MKRRKKERWSSRRERIRRIGRMYKRKSSKRKNRKRKQKIRGGKKETEDDVKEQ